MRTVLDEILLGQESGSYGSSYEVAHETMMQETGSAFSALTSAASKIVDFIREGYLNFELMFSFVKGEIWDANDLTNRIFYIKYPQLEGKKLKAGSAEAKEWLSIRDTLVLPFFGKPENFNLLPITPCLVNDLKSFAPKDKKKTAGDGSTFFIREKSLSPRKLEKVDSIVLHQMAFTRGNNLSKYHEVGAHYIVMNDGKIGQLYDNLDYINASNGFNNRSVAIEFAGNFPDTKFKWWDGSSNRTLLTPAQILGGRCLMSVLQSQLPALKYVYAHRQSSSSRGNDPGPDIWKQVGEWAIGKFGLTDKLPQPFINKGASIPDAWRLSRP